MHTELPPYIGAFFMPVTTNDVAQVAIAAVLVLIVLDVLFGLSNALMQGSYRSEKMREGIKHKCAELGFILVGIVIDATIIGGFDLGFPAPVLVSICVYLALMEVGSLLETFADMNPNLAGSPLFRMLDHTRRDAEVDHADAHKQ